jgi:hypothetical protein
MNADQLKLIRQCAQAGLTMEKTARKAAVAMSDLESGPGAETYLDGLIDAELAAATLLMARAKEGDIGSIKQYLERIMKAQPQIGDDGQ